MSGSSLVSLVDVVDWLRANKLGLTALQLYEELSTNYRSDGNRADATQRRALLSVAELSLPVSSSPGPTPAPTFRDAAGCLDDNELETAVVQGLKWYRHEHTEQELTVLLSEQGLIGASTVTADGTVASGSTALVEMRTSLRDVTRRWQTAEQQHKSLLVLLAQSLPMLVSSIDPMRRESLLPLLKVVAVNGSTSTARDSARHQMLTLFKRPTAGQRGEIARVWLQGAQEAPSQRALEQEIVPQLYGLVNDPKWERRALALDCTAALAPLLSRLPNVRHQLTQGLLKPLSEDESASVRKDVPLCLGALWNAAFEAAATEASSSSRAQEANLARRDSDADSGPLGSQEQFKYAMEVTIQLSIDSMSNTVRHAAQTQLREVMYPLCLQRNVLLNVCVPLLLSFLADEIKPMCSTDGTSSSGGGGAAASSGLRAETSLPLRNTLALLKLVRDALRCVQAEIANVGDRGTADVVEMVMQRLRQVYLEDTLPTAYSLLPLFLNDATMGLGSMPSSTSLLFEPLSPPSPHTRGSLLSLLALVMASIAPMLDAPWWRVIQQFLCASIHLSFEGTSSDDYVHGPQKTTTTTTTTGNNSSSAVEVTAARGAPAKAPADESAMHRRCRLLFFYAFLVRICAESPGGAPVATTAATAAAAPGTMTTACFPTSQPHSFCEQVGREAIALMLRTFPDPSSRLANESLDVCARCLAVLGSSALDDPYVPAGITRLLWTCARASSAAVRSQAVTLISRTCNYLRNDEVKVSLICPPLMVLITDSVYVVQEAAVRCLFRVGAFFSGTTAQEKALQPVMDVVQAAGCTADLTVSFLQYVEELVKEMPSEPRENQLYLLLSVLMDQLADQQTKRVMQRKRSGTSTPASVASSAPGLSTDDVQEQERWEVTMLALQSLLGNNLHCAVVSPHLVAKFLLSGIKHLGSNSVQQVCSSTLRSRWTRLEKAYDLFMENSRSPSALAAQNATNLLNRVRDEFKKRF